MAGVDHGTVRRGNCEWFRRTRPIDDRRFDRDAPLSATNIDNAGGPTLDKAVDSITLLFKSILV